MATFPPAPATIAPEPAVVLVLPTPALQLPTALPLLPTLAPLPPTPEPTAAVEEDEPFVIEEHFTDKWAYMVEEETGSFCLEDEGQEVDLAVVRFGLQPGVELMEWEDSLPLSLVNMEAGPDEVVQYWFTNVPEEGSGRIDSPDNVMVPSEFSYDGNVYKFVVSLVDMREAIERFNVMLLLHGRVAGKEQVLRIVNIPLCQ